MCGNCGSKNIKAVDYEGQSMPWKDYRAVLLTETFEALQCQKCNELILNAKQARSLDAVVESAITHQINIFIKMILQREHCTQIDLASHLGITEVYLSEIKSGKKIPRFQTFNFLKTLALDKASFKISDPSSTDLIKKVVG
ncbi:MAG: hypothetical protein A2Z20_08005 [Bdellovibrionales bacterium RBG_16_40_8]|nr:MAG: hypothetical protein A2Z20_08005 [Bdellovibrionales bacterium RBG_16_40_8]